MDPVNPFRDMNDNDGTNNGNDNPFSSQVQPITNFEQTIPAETKEERLAKLRARANQLRQRMSNAQEMQSEQQNSNPGQPNWPKYVPFLHIDLNNEIPRAAHNCIKFAKIGIILCFVQNFFNFIASCSISGLPSYSYAYGIVFSLIYAFLNGYLTISICFSKLYNACRKRDIPFSFLLFQFALIGFLLYQFVGFPNSGSIGLATFLDLVAKSKSGWSKFIAFLNTCAVLSSVVIQVIVLQQSQKYQKVSGVDDTTAQHLTDMPTIPI